MLIFTFVPLIQVIMMFSSFALTVQNKSNLYLSISFAEVGPQKAALT